MGEISELQPADFVALFYDPAAREGLDFIATTGYLITPGVLSYAQQFVLEPAQGGYYNWSGYANADVTTDILAARNDLDPASSAASFVSAQKIFAPDQLQITLAGAYATSYLRNGLTGITTSIASVGSPWALHLGGE